MFARTKWFLIITCVIFPFSLWAGVWNDTAQWSPRVELKFSNWIKNDFNQDFFITWKSGKYKWITPDCSNVVYSVHLIFAYENKLPFAIVDRYNKPKLITNQTNRFDKYPSGRKRPEALRLKKFIKLIIGRGTTVTLPNDTYPVRLSREHVRSGCIYLNRNWILGSGHAFIIKDILDNGVIKYISGSRGGSKKMAITEFVGAFPDDVYQRNGIRCFIRPGYFGKINSIEGYGLDQFKLEYSLDYKNETENMLAWLQNLQNKLRISKATEDTQEDQKKRFAKNFCSLTRQRVSIVIKGYNYFLSVGRCLTKDEDDEYSTNTKDRKLRDYFFYLHRLNNRNMAVTKQYLNECGTIEYAPGKKMTISYFGEKLFDYQVSSDPHRPVEERWGLEFPKDSSCY